MFYWIRQKRLKALSSKNHNSMPFFYLNALNRT
jgi:hypothetical protein